VLLVGASIVDTIGPVGRIADECPVEKDLEGSDSRVRFEVFTAVTMKNGVFWVVTPCGSCKNRRFGGTWRRNNPEDTILDSRVIKAMYLNLPAETK
jgi:hypothetical protein